MIIDLVPLIAALVIALVLFAGASDRRSRRLLKIGFVIVAACWIPILLAIVLDPGGEVVGNALGLGLLAWLGTLVGALIALFGGALALVRRFSGR